MPRLTHRYLSALFSVFALAFSSAHADGLLDPLLEQRILALDGSHEVIVTFKDRSAVSSLTDLLGVDAIELQVLPMAAARLTEAQIEAVRQWDSVASVYYNAPLEYSNYVSGEITGGHYVHDNYGYKGDGVTVAVLDSGVDGLHPDLAFGGKTVQNVKVLGDLGLIGLDPIYLENVPNTDTSSGHGTHVAGTVAGTGEASANDERRAFYYAGIAPEASIVGIGAGEAIAILYALEGFDYALANQERYGIDVITNSWGGGDGAAFDPNNPINQASYEAYRRGIVVTFAASNSGPAEDTLNQYAVAPWVINVAAGTPEKALADFSSRGVADDFYRHPDITAPGDGIISTRALNTPLPILGPVLDPAHPEYHLYYAGMSGTSMATPFVAGTTALLLQANPDLSPDQIEEILMASAEPMPGYAFHEVGAGYIDVRAAVELAETTVGERAQFLAGDTAWSSDGTWNELDNSSELVQYSKQTQVKNNANASNGSYTVLNRGASAFVRFKGPAVKLVHAIDAKGGEADLYIDSEHHSRVNFAGAQSFGNHASIAGLSDGEHLLELRSVKGKSYVDGFLVDGQAFAPNVTFVDETQSYAGTMGPSAENLEVHEIPFEVGADTVTIAGELAWTGLLDLDLYLVDPEGNEVASGATLENPELLAYDVSLPGTYIWRVTGYTTVIANYTLTETQIKAVAGD